jgi:hypothetical protein
MLLDCEGVLATLETEVTTHSAEAIRDRLLELSYDSDFKIYLWFRGVFERAIDEDRLHLLRRMLELSDPDEHLLHSMAFEHAYTKGKAKAMEIMMDSGRILGPGRMWLTMALVEVVRRGHAEAAALLIDRGADVHFLKSVEHIVVAAMYGHVDVVRILHDRGCGTLEKALTTAVAFGKPEVVRYLLDESGVRVRGEHLVECKTESILEWQACRDMVRTAIMDQAKRSSAAYKIQAAWKRARYQAETYVLGRRYAIQHLVDIMSDMKLVQKY